MDHIILGSILRASQAPSYLTLATPQKEILVHHPTEDTVPVIGGIVGEADRQEGKTSSIQTELWTKN